MPRHSETLHLPYTADEMFAVVADVEHYPEFLPWCSKLTVLSRENQNGVEIVTAEMTVAYNALRERYISRVTLNRALGTIDAVHMEGSFQRLDTRWKFIPRGQGCEVYFFIDFAFKNVLLSTIASVAFGYVTARMVDGFVKRAHALYGSKQAQKLV